MSDMLLGNLIAASGSQRVEVSVSVRGQWVRGAIANSGTFLERYPTLGAEIKQIEGEGSFTDKLDAFYLLLVDVATDNIPHPGILTIRMDSIDAVVIHNGYMSPLRAAALTAIQEAGGSGAEQGKLVRALGRPRDEVLATLDELRNEGLVWLDEGDRLTSAGRFWKLGTSSQA